MKISSRIAGFLVACTLSTIFFTGTGFAQQLNIEVEAVTNPWIANNSLYCTGSNDNCNPKQFYKRPVSTDSTVKKTPTTTAILQQPTSQIPETNEYKKELDSTLLFTLVNDYRARNGLTAFQEDERVCSIAQNRLPDLYNEILGNSWMHKGFFELKLPYWATENIIFVSSEQKALNWWQNSSVHNHALLGNYQYSCVKCQGNTCSQIFTNFQEKSVTPSASQ